MDISKATEWLVNNAHLIAFYIPIGIIGVWRWSVWLFRKIIGLFYRMPRGDFKGSLGIVTPVYNEDPVLFRRALNSWKANHPNEIIAVIDSSNSELIEIFKDFAQTTPQAKLIITEKQGKRPALADGVKASKSDILALVDSDTVWDDGIKDYLIGPFSDPKLGGLVPRQDVMNAKTVAQKIFQIHLANRYLFEFPFLATASDALTCLSGRTAVYRRRAIEGEMDALVNETFLGEKMISGDDKTLTNLVQAKGWRTTFLRDVKVFTTGVRKLSSLLKQELRWARNALRSDLKVIGSGWLWKRNKMLLLHMLDKFVQPVALLLAPIYFVISLMMGFWQGALVIAIWWLVSRTIKILPHLKEHPGDIAVLPVYIVITFVTAIIRIYALLTVDKQGWITRWDEERLYRSRFIDQTISYATTTAVVFALFFAVYSYKNSVLEAAAVEKQIAQEMRQGYLMQRYSINTPDIPRVSDISLAETKNSLMTKNSSDPYGYYVVKSGDTIPAIRKRYNLPQTSVLLDAKTKKALPNLPLRIGQEIAIKTSDLRNEIPKNIAAQNPYAKPPRVTYNRASDTIFVAQGGSFADLTIISRSLGSANSKLLEKTAQGEWILRANLYIGKNVTLILDGSEVSYLKLKSDSEKFVWLRSESGNILISNTKITSWDEKNNAPDTDHEKGRSYITAKNSGRMDIINSEVGYLGYVGLPRRGGPFGGSYGVSWKIKNGGFHDNLLTGVVKNSKFHNNFFGLYTYGATGMLISNNDLYDNIEYGIDPHDDSNNLLIENNRTYRNGKHGIILSRRCFNNVIRNNVSYSNKLHGIMLDRSSNNNLVQNNVVYGNVDGLALYASDGNVIINNESRNNTRGIRLNAGSSGNYVEGNKLLSNSRGVYIYDLAQKNIFLRNEIKQSEIGITIKNASSNILYDNFKSNENQRDGRITTDATGNDIK